jgi:hypothetical protein
MFRAHGVTKMQLTNHFLGLGSLQDGPLSPKRYITDMEASNKFSGKI